MEVKIKVTPGMRKEKITKIDDITFDIQVKEKAEGNQANMRIREIVAEIFSVALSRAHMVRGFRGRNKVIRIT